MKRPRKFGPISERNKTIYRLRKFGLTYKSIGEVFSISGARARQIAMNVEWRIRHYKEGEL